MANRYSFCFFSFYPNRGFFLGSPVLFNPPKSFVTASEKSCWLAALICSTMRSKRLGESFGVCSPPPKKNVWCLWSLVIWFLKCAKQESIEKTARNHGKGKKKTTIYYLKLLKKQMQKWGSLAKLSSPQKNEGCWLAGLHSLLCWKIFGIFLWERGKVR